MQALPQRHDHVCVAVGGLERQGLGRMAASGGELAAAASAIPPAISNSSSPADTAPAARQRSRRRPSIGVTTIGVIKLLAPRATTSRSKRINSSPARTDCPRPYARLESTAAQLHGIDSDVNQHVDALSGPDRDRMGARRQGDDFTGAGREQHRAGGVDGDSVAQHASRKYRIGDLVERAAPAVEGRQDL